MERGQDRQPLQVARKGASLQNLFHHPWQVWVVSVPGQPRQSEEEVEGGVCSK